MADIQTTLKNAMAARRVEIMKTSKQLTVGEAIILLKAVTDKTLPVVFDGGKRWPLYLLSWRGAHEELAIAYSSKADEGQISCRQLLRVLQLAIGKVYGGYKGGDFIMGKNTPLWVAKYGESTAWGDNNRGVVGIKEQRNFVSILTKKLEY